MSNNYQVIYEFKSKNWRYFQYILRILLPIKNYFYNLFVYCSIKLCRYLPLRPYMNNTGFKL